MPDLDRENMPMDPPVGPPPEETAIDNSEADFTKQEIYFENNEFDDDFTFDDTEEVDQTDDFEEPPDDADKSSKKDKDDKDISQADDRTDDNDKKSSKITDKNKDLEKTWDIHNVGNGKKENIFEKIKGFFRRIYEAVKDVFFQITEPGYLYARLAGGKELANKIYDANMAEQARQHALEREKANNINKELKNEIDALKAQLGQTKAAPERVSAVSAIIQENGSKDQGDDKDTKQAAELLNNNKDNINKINEAVKQLRDEVKNNPMQTEEDKAKFDNAVKDIRESSRAMKEVTTTLIATLGKLEYKVSDEMKAVAEEIDAAQKEIQAAEKEVNDIDLDNRIKVTKETLEASKDIIKEQSERLKNPDITPEEKAEAQNLVETAQLAAAASVKSLMSACKGNEYSEDAKEKVGELNKTVVEIKEFLEDIYGKSIDEIAEEAPQVEEPEKEKETDEPTFDDDTEPSKGVRGKIDDLNKEGEDIDNVLADELSGPSKDISQEVTEADIEGLDTGSRFDDDLGL